MSSSYSDFLGAVLHDLSLHSFPFHPHGSPAALILHYSLSRYDEQAAVY